MSFVILCDFDGTITTEDTLDYIADLVFGIDNRKQLEDQLQDGTLSYASYLYKFHNICFDIRKLPDFVDTHFQKFYEKYCKNISILSKGMSNIIKHMVPFVDSSKIIGHDMTIDTDNIWHIDDNVHIINKRDIVSEFRKQYPFIIFIGDGISDFEVVDVVDLLFVKEASHLHNYIIKHHPNVNMILFKNFHEIMTYIDKHFNDI